MKKEDSVLGALLNAHNKVKARREAEHGTEGAKLISKRDDLRYEIRELKKIIKSDRAAGYSTMANSMDLSKLQAELKGILKEIKSLD